MNLHVGQIRMKLQKSDTVLNPISIGEMLYVAITTIWTRSQILLQKTDDLWMPLHQNRSAFKNVIIFGDLRNVNTKGSEVVALLASKNQNGWISKLLKISRIKLILMLTRNFSFTLVIYLTAGFSEIYTCIMKKMLLGHFKKFHSNALIWFQ